MSEHWFWLTLTISVVVWYSTITVYVSYKGAHDIKTMLRDLKANHATNQDGNV